MNKFDLLVFSTGQALVKLHPLALKNTTLNALFCDPLIDKTILHFIIIKRIHSIYYFKLIFLLNYKQKSTKRIIKFY